jgi:hypothetical protein
LYQFEKGLNPQKPNDSPIPAAVLGYGEISAIFQVGQDAQVAYKRMPLFRDRPAAEKYTNQYREYCQLLQEAGLKLPQHDAVILEVPDRPVVCYIGQKRLPENDFGHRLIHHLGMKEIRFFIETVVLEIAKIWQFNHRHTPSLELALDGQISNWVRMKDREAGQPSYVDTSTPLYRKDGVEQLDPELFLQSAPFFLRWIIRLLFLEDVMNRYYDARLVYTDLAANLYKEQRPDLVTLAVNIINDHLSGDLAPLTLRTVEKYYKQDKLIWTLFLAFRRLDRRLTTTVLRKRYEFILPGKIKR